MERLGFIPYPREQTSAALRTVAVRGPRQEKRRGEKGCLVVFDRGVDGYSFSLVHHPCPPSRTQELAGDEEAPLRCFVSPSGAIFAPPDARRGGWV